MLQCYFTLVIISIFGTTHYIFSTALFFDKVPGWNEWELWCDLQCVQVVVIEAFFYSSSKRCLQSLLYRAEEFCYSVTKRKNILLRKYKAKKCLRNLQSFCGRGRLIQKIVHLLLQLWWSNSSPKSWQTILVRILRTTYKINHNLKIFHFLCF